MAVTKPLEPTEADHYHELELENNATAAEIRKSYLSLSLQYHPDKLPDGASDTKFKKVGV